MTNTKQELIQYTDACVEYDIPMNAFTYYVYRVSSTPVLINTIKNLIVRVNYFLKK